MAGTEATDSLTIYLSLLTADATLQGLGLTKWFKDVAQTPADGSSPWPCGIGQVQSAIDVTFMSAIRVGTDILLTFRLVGKDSDFTTILRPAYRRVDALLQGTAGSSADVTILGKAVREQFLDYSEIVNGEVYRNLGGTYRILGQ